MASDAQNGKKYKFMTTILREARERSLYIDALEKITTDPRVPIVRIIISIAAVGVAIIGFLWVITSNIQRAAYLWMPSLLILVSVAVIAIYYLISSRDKSVLESVVDLILFKVTDHARMQTDSKSIRNFGVSEINNSGVIRMFDNRVAVLYEVAGQMSYSMLPQIAEQLSAMRSGHFISRTSTSQEILLTSVKVVDLTSHIKHFRSLSENADNDGMASLWRSYMSNMVADYIDDSLNKKETSVVQYLLVIDESAQALKRTMAAEAQSFDNGIWSMMRRVQNKNEVENVLGSLLLMEER